MTLSTFVLVGTVLSHDQFLATVKFELNPSANGGASIGVLPVEAIPCDIEVGKTIYVVKDEKQEVPTISCKNESR